MCKPVFLLACALIPRGYAAESPKIYAGSISNCGKLARYVRPVYPATARQQHITGTVKLRAVVGVNGRLRNIEVLEGNPLLVAEVLRVVRKWRYAPCRLNGGVVETITSIEIPFTLSQ